MGKNPRAFCFSLLLSHGYNSVGLLLCLRDVVRIQAGRGPFRFSSQAGGLMLGLISELNRSVFDREDVYNRFLAHGFCCPTIINRRRVNSRSPAVQALYLKSEEDQGVVWHRNRNDLSGLSVLWYNICEWLVTFY